MSFELSLLANKILVIFYDDGNLMVLFDTLSIEYFKLFIIVRESFKIKSVIKHEFF